MINTRRKFEKLPSNNFRIVRRRGVWRVKAGYHINFPHPVRYLSQLEFWKNWDWDFDSVRDANDWIRMFEPNWASITFEGIRDFTS